MAPPTDVEKDPLFRGLVLLLAVGLIVMMGFNALYRGRSIETAAASTFASDQSPATTHANGGHMTAEQMAASHEKSMTAYPAKTSGLGGQVLEPLVEDGVKVFELMAMPLEWEVAPGQIVTAWAYNGQVPGPEIRVARGDRVRVNLTTT